MSNDNVNTILKWLGAVLGLTAWGFFAYKGLVPMDGFIVALSGALGGIGVHAVTSSSNKPPGGPPNA